MLKDDSSNLLYDSIFNEKDKTIIILQSKNLYLSKCYVLQFILVKKNGKCRFTTKSVTHKIYT